jgi:hypothetical protein
MHQISKEFQSRALLIAIKNYIESSKLSLILMEFTA